MVPKPTRKEVMRWALLGIVAVAAGFFIYQQVHPLAEGTPMPDHTLRSYDGKKWTLDRFKGKPIVVNFWAPWCTPCMQELPDINRFAVQHVDDVVVVGAVVNASRKRVLDTIQKYGIRYPVAEASPEMIENWKAHSLPTTVIVAPSGEIAWSGVGQVDEAFLTSQIERL